MLDDVTDDDLMHWADTTSWGRWPHPVDDRANLTALRAEAYAVAAETRALRGKLLLAVFAVGAGLFGSQALLAWVQHWNSDDVRWAEIGGATAAILAVMLLEHFRVGLERWQARAKMYRHAALELEAEEQQRHAKRARHSVRHRSRKRRAPLL